MTATEKSLTGIDKKLYYFLDVLRDTNIKISTDEVLSLFSSLKHIPFLEKDIFKQTLQTTLIKDFTDIPIFDTCFEEYFGGIKNLTNNMDELNTTDKNSSKRMKNIKELEEKINDFINTLEDNLLFEKSSEDLLNLFLEEITEAAESSGGMGMMLFQLKKSRMSMARSEEEAEQSEENEIDEELNNFLINLIDSSVKKRTIGKEVKDREDYLLNKNIYQLTPEEIKEMRELIKRFGQKLKNRISLRKKRVKNGGIDIKRTFRNSMQYGGIPFKIFYKNRKIDRPQLVVLCDVSGSVNQYTRFMLLLTHTLQGLFSKVRTFAFISNMIEITNLFMEMNPERAINSIFTDIDFTYGWGSNYGGSFDQFISKYSDSLGNKTTILILGDARNNNQDAGLGSLARMNESSRNIFWLNPEKKHLWDWNDSIASQYAPFCNNMKEVNNFLDLSEFIEQLFP